MPSHDSIHDESNIITYNNIQQYHDFYISDSGIAYIKGTADLKQKSFLMAIFLSGLKIFKVAFQDLVDYSREISIAHFSAINLTNITLF